MHAIIRRLGATVSGDKRGMRPLAMWKEDFDKFVAMANELVTADNQHYVCVLVGRARRPGSGLFMEAGLSAERQVLQAFGIHQNHQNLHFKQFQLCFTGASAAAKGVSGVLSETMYFFYKGTWPNTLVPMPRETFGGTTWDDIWGSPLVPQCCRNRYSLQDQGAHLRGGVERSAAHGWR